MRIPIPRSKVMAINKEYRRGFTLIELLIVIAIIALLVTIVIVALADLQKKGRDARRQSDLNTIRSALEQFRADQGYYPQTLGSSISFSSGGTTRTYLNTVPAESMSGISPYCYSSTCPTGSTKCTSYRLYAKLDTIGAGTLSCGLSSDYNFQLTPP